MKRTVFTGRQTDEISFPLGGIGTGSIGLAGNGRLIDWEIKNIPDKGSVNGYTHFAVKAEKNGKLKDARVICGDVYKNLSGQTGKDFGYGLTNTSMEGFPHFKECVFTGEFPVADVSLDDPDSACSVKLTAFNPFIVQNEKDSSIPAAFFDITVTNKTSETLDFTMAGTLCNMYAGSTDKYFRSDGISGMLMTGKCEDRNSPDFGEMALCTDWNDVSYQEYWYRGDWFDNLEMYWRNFTRKPRFENRSYDAPGNGDHATIAAHFTLAAGESKTIKWNICWYNPVKPDQWYYEGEQPMVVRNYYSYVYGGARDVAEYCMKNRDRLTEGTMRWHDELFASTLPEEVIEAIRKIIGAGVPVMGHLGLMPQSINKYGTFGVRAKEDAEADKLLRDAKLLEEAGCFALVLEKIPAALAKQVTESLRIPVIGIGAGGATDGQVLVVADMLGMTKGFSPKFLRRYADLNAVMTDAIGQYVTDVKSGDFPNESEQY